jgi:hypothetical protein
MAIKLIALLILAGCDTPLSQRSRQARTPGVNPPHRSTCPARRLDEVPGFSALQFQVIT